MTADRLRPESVVVATGRPAREPAAPLNAPLVLSVPFHHDPEDTNRYLRNESSDTVRAFEEAIGALDGGPAVAFASGMAAIAAVIDLVPAGAIVVVPESAYSGSMSLFADSQSRGRLVLRPVDIADTAAVEAALPGAALLWAETVTNPLLAVADLPAIAGAASEAGAMVAVDATFSTPLVVRPLEQSADLVVHSATKYLSGHADTLLGVVVARDEELAAALRERRRLTGAMPGTLECFLALRGLRTLAVRMDRAQENAAELARRLEDDPRVSRVRFPGLPSDPGHERAARYDGFGAMIAFEVAVGPAGDATVAAERVCARVNLITHATSLGGVESLIERRARYPVDRAGGAPDALLRLSVGIEHVEDLWHDLDQALGDAPA